MGKGNHRGASLRLPLQPVRANAGLNPSSRICVLCSNTHFRTNRIKQRFTSCHTVELTGMTACMQIMSRGVENSEWIGTFYFCPVTIWEIETLSE